ncbi:hypothetical protein OGY69_07600 [Citrobacter sp. Cpo086]|uniref:hypothetical protein n=1 Tax=Citrobacter TaxID=544 RepID=UPI002576B44C|nr:hypothetical protein [Citrobacter sp. Cpo086]MDM2838722.1 hypothetical protein [Citrobacter sp. Cpo086]
MKNQQTTRTASHGLLLLCTLLSAVALSGCGDKDEREFIRGCKFGGGTTAICGCIYDDLKTKYPMANCRK